MSFFKRIFGLEKTVSKQEAVKKPNAKKNKFLPEEPEEFYDKQFVINFKKNGGKFIYTTNLDELNDALTNILAENQWRKIGCKNPNLKHLLKHRDLKTTAEYVTPEAVFVSCEYLVASSGAIVFSAKQIGEKPLDQLADNFIVYATTSQLVRSIDDSMRSMKQKYKNNFPSNIRTLKTFEENNEENDFRKYGNVSKNLYLLLLEDL